MAQRSIIAARTAEIINLLLVESAKGMAQRLINAVKKDALAMQ